MWWALLQAGLFAASKVLTPRGKDLFPVLHDGTGNQGENH